MASRILDLEINCCHCGSALKIGRNQALSLREFCSLMINRPSPNGDHGMASVALNFGLSCPHCEGVSGVEGTELSRLCHCVEEFLKKDQEPFFQLPPGVYC